jgi:hypothetical protein
MHNMLITIIYMKIIDPTFHNQGEYTYRNSALENVTQYANLFVTFNYVTLVRNLQNCVHCSRAIFLYFCFLWWRAPQQMLRTHRSQEAYCATLWCSFSFFLVKEPRWNETDRGKPKYSGEKPVPVPLCPPQIPHGLTRDRTQASAVRGRRLTAWAMARPSVIPC